MSKLFIAWLSLCIAFGATDIAFAHEPDPRDDGHPLEMVSYVLHPIGFALHEGVYKPIHKLVSTPGLDKVFGHKPDIFAADFDRPVPVKAQPEAQKTEEPAPPAEQPEASIEPVTPEDTK